MIIDTLVNDEIAVSIHESRGSKKLFVLLPGFLDSKDYAGLVGLANDLQGVGWTVIRVDSFGTWKSKGAIGDYSTTRRLQDVDLVIDFAKKVYGTEQIFVGGHSMGGRVAMLYAGRHLGVAAVIVIMSGALSSMAVRWEKGKAKSSSRDLPENPKLSREFVVPYSFAEDALQYNAIEDIPRIKVPILFIAGEQDTLISPEKIKAGYLAANEPKKFVIIPDVGHDYRHEPAQIPLVSHEVLKFLREQKFI